LDIIALDEAQFDLGASAALSGGKYFIIAGKGVTGLEGIGNVLVCGMFWLSKRTGGI
jgi:hypothetical protein